jgi:vacuolar-type H+-ATPase subunit I/STV1
VNREDLADCPDLLDDYLQNKKQLWALVHDITIYGHDVELYAQDNQTAYPKKQGVYSVKDKSWIAQPKFEAVDFRGPALLAKVKQYTERIDTLISTNAEDESFSKLKEKFKNMRSSGLKKIGEFSMENLVFKELRNRGVIDKMTQYLRSRQDEKLSLTENYPFQIQIHHKDSNELVAVKQLNSERKDTAMAEGLRSMQSLKREYPNVGDHHFSVRFPHDRDWIAPPSE